VADVVVSTLYAMKEKLMEYQYRYKVRNPPRAVLFADPRIALLFHAPLYKTVADGGGAKYPSPA
jgi:hypothetical protein